MTALEAQILIQLELQTTLDPVAKEDIKINRHIATTLKGLFPEVPGVTDAIENTIVEKSGTLLHHNLMHYLTLAYNNHFSVVLSPDMIFYTILCELADAIKTKPDSFRFLFTNSGEKTTILTQTHDPAYLDLDQVIAGISANIAVDASIFTADFSCSTIESKLAIKAAFCDAMSPYFHYMNTRCGIPRIKVLGSQQDWISLETKVYRMATEVFNQVGDEKLTKYIFGAQEIVRQMRTETDPSFWGRIFAIDRCRSGHTDLVVGWITSLFRKGADDFYKYESHISSVEWTNLETGNEYQLRTGLFYSVIYEGESELDKQFPWLEPKFAHIVLDKNAKMNPEQYKEYINNVLKREDKTIFLGFFDVLKDEGLVIKKGNTPQIQRLEIVGKQFDYWGAHPDQPIDLIDFNDNKFDAALTSYNQDNIKELANKTFQKLKKVFDTCQIRRFSLPGYFTNMLYDNSAEMLQLLTGKTFLEELTLESDSDAIFAALLNLLSDPNCRLKHLAIAHYDFDEKRSMLLAEKILQMKFPLKKITLRLVPEIKLAEAIFTLATNGSLTSIFIASDRGDQAALDRVIEAISQAKNLEEVELPDLKNPKNCKELARGWQGNTTLTNVEVREWNGQKNELQMALTLPSLKSLKLENAISGMEFLRTTTKLQKLEISLEVSLEAAKGIADLLALDACQLQALIFRRMGQKKLTPGVVKALSKGLAVNRSLKIFKCELASNDEGTEELTASLLTQQGLEELNIEGFLTNQAAQENLIKFVEKSKCIRELTYNLEYYNDKDVPKWPQRERLINAIHNSETLTAVSLLGMN